MALYKEEIAYNGQVMTYHRLDSFHIDMATGAGTVTLFSWASEAERIKHNPPIMKRKFNFQWTSEDMTADAYAAVKQLPHWADAVDV